jgi:hypothetical protein
MIRYSHSTGFPARRVYIVTGASKAKRLEIAQPFITAFGGITLTGTNKLIVLI